MPRARTIFRFLFFLLLLLVLTAGIGLTHTIRTPFPITAGTVELDGLRERVTVKRDALGVAHIYAQNTEDLFFAQGYTHAQDRFWQMEFWRHISMGRISEIVGEPTVETDKFIRNLGWNRIAADSAENYRLNHPDMWAILEAYSAGVNAWIAENSDSISFNQTVLNLSSGPWEIEPWEPIHTVGWGVVMAWDLKGTSNMDTERLWAELEDALGSDVLEQLIPPYPDNRPIIAPTTANSSAPFQPSQFSTVSLGEFDMIGQAPENGFALGSGPAVGSNNWAVAGEHTSTGLPLLANDPHLGVQLPSIWYWNSLHAPGWDVAGMSFPGAPAVIAGHNGTIAWGLTNMAADSQDVYIEKLNPLNRLQYEFEGEWRDMEVIEEEIRVNGGESIVLEVRKTHHGPLLNNVNSELEQALAVRWTAFEPSRIFQAVVELNQAENYDDFRAALSKWDTSPQNIVYADIEGNIAYQSTGLYPRRDGWEGLRPVPGWTGEYEWDGFIPYDDMPRVLNPPEGYIVTANNAIVDDAFPYYLARNWTPGDRGQRIIDLLEAAIAEGTVSAETFEQIQNDNYDLLIDSYRPLFSDLRSDDPLVQESIERLRGWDGQLAVDSVPATIFEAFILTLLTNVTADETGDLSEQFISLDRNHGILMHALAADLTHPFWDDVNTAATETASAVVLATFEETIAWMGETFGRNPDDWQWGNVHQVTFRSNPLGESGIEPLERIVNRGPVAVGGSGRSVNANAFGWDIDSFATVRSNPSMRMIIDLGDFNNSRAIHPTGQSGHPFHPHYDDMIDLWAAGSYHDFAFGTSKIDAMTEQILTLDPK